jgi:ParB family chromosome partitioning protein
MSNAAPDMKRRALGKGLDSLLPRVPVAPAVETEGGKPREIPLDQLDRNPFQTRTRMNEEQLEELSASIAANGVVQPILVRPLANGRFQLIAGERRWRASAQQSHDSGDSAPGLRRAGDGNHHRREPATRRSESDGAGARL